MLTPEKLGSRLKFHREQKRLSQAELGRLAGDFEQSVISDLERGRRRMTVIELLKLSYALDIHPYYELLADSPPSQHDPKDGTDEMEEALLKAFRRLPSGEKRLRALTFFLVIADLTQRE